MEDTPQDPATESEPAAETGFFNFQMYQQYLAEKRATDSDSFPSYSEWHAKRTRQSGGGRW